MTPICGRFCWISAIFTVNSPFLFKNSLVPSKGSININSSKSVQSGI